MIHIFHPGGASSVGPDEGGVSRVPRSGPGPVVRQQTAAHHQVSGLADGHPGGRPESHSRKSGVKFAPAGPLFQGPRVPHHQPTHQGSHLVSHGGLNEGDQRW